MPDHCYEVADRHGKRRVRFFYRGFSTYLHGLPWSESFMRAWATAMQTAQAQRPDGVGVERTAPGSFSALCAAYYRSPAFLALKPGTQRHRRNIIERFREEHGNKPLAKLERRNVEDIIGERKDTPQAANKLLKLLRTMLNFAIAIGMIDSNPTLGVTKYPVGRGYHTWTEAEIRMFEGRHPVGTRARLAMALLLYTAQRRSDVVNMGWQHVRGDELAVLQQKTGTALIIPIVPELRLALESVPRSNLPFLVTEQGAPFTAAGFGNWFREQCKLAGLPKRCSAHGLRKAAARRMAEAGRSANEIAAITGHRSLEEVAHYTRAADQRRLARQAMGLEGEQKFSNLGPHAFPTSRR